MGLQTSGIAPFAPRAARTTGSVATTPDGQTNWVRAARFYFFSLWQKRSFESRS
jgi:hypothetical protein